MYKISVDTSVLLNRTGDTPDVPKSRRAEQAARVLFAADEDGIVDVACNIVESCSLKDPVALAGVSITAGPWLLGVSHLGHDTVLGTVSDDRVDLVEFVQNTIRRSFPAHSPQDVRNRNDYGHLVGHICAGRELFETEDQDFLKYSSEVV